jgi:hypothetical protein
MRSTTFSALAGAVLLGLVSVAVAHGHDEDMNMDIGDSSFARPTILSATSTATSVPVPEAYWNYGEHRSLLAAHITLMTIAWIFVLPIGMPFSSFEFLKFTK